MTLFVSLASSFREHVVCSCCTCGHPQASFQLPARDFDLPGLAVADQYYNFSREQPAGQGAQRTDFG